MQDKIIFFDTTLRDGEQAPGYSMTTEQKLKMALQLELLGVDVIEAGFPVASTGDFESVKSISKAVHKCTIAGLCRTKFSDIDRAWEALQYAKHPRIHTFIATSDIHMKHKLNLSRKEVLGMAVRAVEHARKYLDDVEFSAEDAVRSDPDFLCEIIEAVIDAGAGTVNIPDTVGYALPREFAGLIGDIIDKVSNSSKAIISVHCHNDLGLAVANSLAAIRSGARQVECTINGIGERAGNAALEELVMTMNTRQDILDFQSRINTAEIYKSSRLLINLTGTTVQRNKAIVGENAFAHEAGIHQHGMMNNAQTYEIMTPESVGVPRSTLVLGKHSGRHALGKRYKELGYKLSKSELNETYTAFTQLADKKKSIHDEDLLAILPIYNHEFPEIYEFKGIQVLSGSTITPTATVRLSRENEEIEDSSIGDGPVDAVFNALERITGIPCTLTDYAINSIGTGKDAMGEVLLRVEYQKQSFSGRGTSTDVIEASAKAYINALNRIAFLLEKDEINHKLQETQ